MITYRHLAAVMGFVVLVALLLLMQLPDYPFLDVSVPR